MRLETSSYFIFTATEVATGFSGASQVGQIGGAKNKRRFGKENDAGGTGASARGNELTAARCPHCALNRRQLFVSFHSLLAASRTISQRHRRLCNGD
jgi:hypothetical protein